MQEVPEPSAVTPLKFPVPLTKGTITFLGRSIMVFTARVFVVFALSSVRPFKPLSLVA